MAELTNLVYLESEIDSMLTDMTNQGNTFNGADQLVQLDSEGKLPEAVSSTETTFTNGYDLQNTDSMPDLAFDIGTRTFSCAVKAAQSSFHFWCDGEKITKTTTQTVVIPDTTGLYYVYFDNSGVLQYISVGSVPDVAFYEYAITGMVRWNATQGLGGAANEMHGIRMSSATHKYNHDTFGARYASGFNPIGLTDGNTTFTQTNSGKFWDEDIEHSVEALSTQPWLYRLGATGEWTSVTADNEVGLKESGDTYYSWNEWTGSTWQLTEGGISTDYFITFLLATPSIGSNGVIKVPSHNAYPNVTDARNAIESEREQLDMGDLVSPELVFLYAIIVKRDGTLQELSDGSTYYDLRVSKGSGGGASATSSLAADIPTDTTNFDGALSSADTNIQKALDTLNDSALVNVNNTFTKAQRGAITTLTYSTTVSIDFDTNNRYKLTLTADTATMSAPTNVTAGQGGVIYIIQDSTGGWDLAQGDWNSVYKFLDSYTLDETASATNVFNYEVLDSSTIVMSHIGSF